MSIPADVSKKDPVTYGEFLLKQMAVKNVTQSGLAKELGQNRTELGRYVRIGKWGKQIKEYISTNRNYITNTSIIKAARDFKNENDALSYLKNVVEEANNASPYPTPIPSIHMLKSLQQENRRLKEDVSTLRETLSSLNKRFISFQKCINSHTADYSPPKKHSDTLKKCISLKAIKCLGIKLGNNLKYNLMTAVFWVFIVPITAMFIEHCLNNFSIQSLPYLSSLPVTYLALLLAITFDLLIFSLLNRNSKSSKIIGGILITLNSAGAYFISSKNSQWKIAEKIKNEVVLIKTEIISLQDKVANKKIRYLVAKWPNQINPSLCEENKVKCGLPYTSKAQNEFIEYLSANELLLSKKEIGRAHV